MGHLPPRPGHFLQAARPLRASAVRLGQLAEIRFGSNQERIIFSLSGTLRRRKSTNAALDFHPATPKLRGALRISGAFALPRRSEPGGMEREGLPSRSVQFIVAEASSFVHGSSCRTFCAVAAPGAVSEESCRSEFSAGDRELGRSELTPRGERGGAWCNRPRIAIELQRPPQRFGTSRYWWTVPHCFAVDGKFFRR